MGGHALVILQFAAHPDQIDERLLRRRILLQNPRIQLSSAFQVFLQLKGDGLAEQCRLEVGLFTEHAVVSFLRAPGGAQMQLAGAQSQICFLARGVGSQGLFKALRRFLPLLGGLQAQRQIETAIGVIGIDLEQAAVSRGRLFELLSLVMNVADRRMDLGALLPASQGALQLHQRLISSTIEVQRHGPGEQLRRSRRRSDTWFGDAIRPTLLVTHALLLFRFYRHSSGKLESRSSRESPHFPSHGSIGDGQFPLSPQKAQCHLT